MARLVIDIDHDVITDQRKLDGKEFGIVWKLSCYFSVYVLVDDRFLPPGILGAVVLYSYPTSSSGGNTSGSAGSNDGRPGNSLNGTAIKSNAIPMRAAEGSVGTLG